MAKRIKNPLFNTDGYKPSHIDQYADNMDTLFSNFTPRGDKYFTHYAPNAPRGVISAGVQGVLKERLIDDWNENFFSRPKDEVVAEYSKFMTRYNGRQNRTDHIEALHDLGYLPLSVRALPEGVLCPIQVPVYTIHNTVKGFAWLVNYLETMLSAETWKTMNNATIAFQYRLLGEQYADLTCDSKDHLAFQFHDFSARGLSGIDDGYRSGFGHLMSFKGTDTLRAVCYVDDFYYGEDTFVAGSIPASEHSVATTNISDILAKLMVEVDGFAAMNIDEQRFFSELEFLRKYLTQIYPDGIVSYVADSYDYWALVTEILPVLKQEIMERDGKLVIRPDSGKPLHIICGYYVETFASREIFENSSRALLTEVAYIADEQVYLRIQDNEQYGYEEYVEIPRHEAVGTIQVLWEEFGGKINSKGYKELDSHIGLIYGDSITVSLTKEIFKRLEGNGFASSNIVLGVGSYTYNYSTRDTFGFACKATGCVIDGNEILVSKEPKTDPGKRSARGFLAVVANPEGDLTLEDGLSLSDVSHPKNELLEVFRDSLMVIDTNIDEVRATLDDTVRKYLK